jgi:hypothetical protein
MIENMELEFDQPAIVDPEDKPKTIEAAFELFHAANPSIYLNLVELSRALKRKGRNKIGIGMLFEILRWRFMMTSIDSNSEFKLNNNYRSRYARRIMSEEIDLEGFFETRELKSK